jgi:hypothetical protein
MSAALLFLLLSLSWLSLIFSFRKKNKNLNTTVIVDGACPGDNELEKMVKKEGTKTLMYIIAYNDASEFIANQYARCRKSWVKVIRIPLTKYYESSVYFYLDDHQLEWRKYQYIVISTYKSLTPSLLHPSLPPQTFGHVKQMLLMAENNIADVYPFVRGNQRLLNATVSYHGEDFAKAWSNILTHVGVPHNLVDKCNQMYPFYRNLYMIKPHLLERLTNSMKKIFKVTSENQFMKQLLEKDAHYRLGAPHIAKKMFGTPYYQYHPFLFQLLPPCILKLMGVRICIAPIGECGVNYMYEG